MITKQDLKVLGWEHYCTVGEYEKYLKHFGNETYQLSTDFKNPTVKILFKYSVNSSMEIFFGKIESPWDLHSIEKDYILKPILSQTQTM